MKPLSSGFRHFFVVLLSAILLLCCGCHDTAKPTTARETSSSEKYGAVDADAYYKANSKDCKTILVQSSANVQSEKEIYAFLQERGFTDAPITYQYNMDGTITDETEIDAASDEQHPVYETYYTTDEETFFITISNGEINAFPLKYNMESEFEYEFYIAEKDSLTCYDSAKNSFFVCSPKENIAKIKTVNTIDTKTLDSVTQEAMNES